MGYGDELMAAGQAQRVYEADPSRRVAICDRVGDVRWHPVWEHNPIVARPEEVAAGEPVHRIRNGVGCRPYIRSLTVESGLRCTDWRARDHRPVLHLTDEERKRGRRDLARAMKRTRRPVVILEPSIKAQSSPNKQWGAERYAAVVAACSEIQFVQMLHEGIDPIAGVATVWTASFREACAVLAAADGYLGPEGGLHHAAAALNVAAVVLFGGFISPETTGYPDHVNLADTGPGSPCGCWKPCPHCRAAMDRISVDAVMAAVRHRLAMERAA